MNNNLVYTQIDSRKPVSITNPTCYEPNAIIERYLVGRGESVQSIFHTGAQNGVKAKVIAKDFFMRAVRNEEYNRIKNFIDNILSIYVPLILISSIPAECTKMIFGEVTFWGLIGKMVSQCFLYWIAFQLGLPAIDFILTNLYEFIYPDSAHPYYSI